MFLFHATAASGGKDFSRAQVAPRVEGVAQIRHSRQIAIRKHFVHEMDFLHAYSMLAGDASATLQALLQDFVTR